MYNLVGEQDATASCSGVVNMSRCEACTGVVNMSRCEACSGIVNMSRCETMTDAELDSDNWKAAQTNCIMTDYSDEDESMEPDCSCSSDTSYESDDSPRRRRTQIRKRKSKAKKSPRRGRPKGRPARKREESDSTSSSDSSGSPPRQGVYWEKRLQNSRTPPRRKIHTYASMNCQRNYIPVSKRLEQYNRSRSANGVSIGRRAQRAVDGTYNVEFWGSDDDDFPPTLWQRSLYKGRYFTPAESSYGAFMDRGNLPQTR
ncbi:hypothetical protein KC19_3G033800 [Ceratodon purpureus]|uniref:Uncharacterized protein n=1 Tax=Ceratodon purpureus TaxID=3225 RepID=A0A8T0IEB6_CERPU|nr:hypothetical protein KC19_3G033800 [Ceratodon purpureus]